MVNIDAIHVSFSDFHKIFPYHKTHRLKIKGVYNLTEGSLSFSQKISSFKPLSDYVDSNTSVLLRFGFDIGVKLNWENDEICEKMGD